MDTTTSQYTVPIPLNVSNGLPTIDLWFGSDNESEVGFMCYIDTCAAMNTGNLNIHQWLINQYPYMVAEYIQYDDVNTFEPLKLIVTIKDLEKVGTEHGKLTAIVRYKLRCK